MSFIIDKQVQSIQTRRHLTFYLNVLYTVYRYTKYLITKIRTPSSSLNRMTVFLFVSFKVSFLSYGSDLFKPSVSLIVSNQVRKFV